MARRCIPVFVLLLSSVGGLGRAQQVSDGQLPEEVFPQLGEILKTALLHSPVMLAQQLEIAQSEARRYQESAARWPSLTASTWYLDSRAEGENSTTASSGLVYGVNLSQPVYQWGALQAQSEIAALGELIAERRYAEAFRNLAVNLRSQYLQLILLKGGVRQAQGAFERQERALRELDDRIASGLAAAGDRWSVNHAVEQARLFLDRQRAGYESARKVFARLAGLENFSDEAVPMEIPVPGVAANEPFRAVAAAEGPARSFRSPQSDILALNIRQSELSYRIATARLRPKFFFRAGYGLDTSTSVDGAGRVNQANVASTSFRLGFDWTLFDGWATRGAKLSAVTTQRTYEQELAAYLNSQETEIAGTVDAIEFARRDLALAQVEVDVSGEALRRAEQMFANGRIAERELEQSQIRHDSDLQTIYSRRADYFNAWSRYLSAAGIDPILDLLPERYLSDDR